MSCYTSHYLPQTKRAKCLIGFLEATYKTFQVAASTHLPSHLEDFKLPMNTKAKEVKLIFHLGRMRQL
jgi:hypothetical protein